MVELLGMRHLLGRPLQPYTDVSFRSSRPRLEAGTQLVKRIRSDEDRGCLLRESGVNRRTPAVVERRDAGLAGCQQLCDALARRAVPVPVDPLPFEEVTSVTQLDELSLGDEEVPVAALPTSRAVLLIVLRLPHIS